MQKENQCFILGRRHKLSRCKDVANPSDPASSVHKGFVLDKSQLETILGPSRPDWFERLTEQRLDWKLTSKPAKSTVFDSPSTPTISQLISVNSLKVGNSPKFSYDSPVQFRSSGGQSPVLTPNCWNDWQKPLLGYSPSPRHTALNTTFGHLSSTGVRSLGVNADDSALAWTNSLATPPRDLSELSADQDTSSTGHKDLARALFSPCGDRLDVTGDSVKTLDSTFEEDFLPPLQPSDIHQELENQHKSLQQCPENQQRILQKSPQNVHKLSTVQDLDNTNNDLNSEKCSPILVKPTWQQKYVSPIQTDTSNPARVQECISIENQSKIEYKENANKSPKHVKKEAPQSPNDISNKINKKICAIKLKEENSASKTVLKVCKSGHKSKVHENEGSNEVKTLSTNRMKELSIEYDRKDKNTRINEATNSQITKLVNHGKRTFDEVDQAEPMSETNISVTSPKFSQKCSRKHTNTKKKATVEKKQDWWQTSSVDEALSDFFDSPATVARKRRRTSLPAGYTFKTSQNSPPMPTDSASQVRCSTPKDRAPLLQSILSSSQKKKTCRSVSEKKVRFSDCVKKYSILSEFSPILKKRKKNRHSKKHSLKDQILAESDQAESAYDHKHFQPDSTHSVNKESQMPAESNKAESAYEHRHLQPGCSQDINMEIDTPAESNQSASTSVESDSSSYVNVKNEESSVTDKVNPAGEHKVMEVKQKMMVNETGDSNKKQIKCKMRLTTKTNNNHHSLTDSLSQEYVKKEEQEENVKHEKMLERRGDVGADEFSQISPSALNEMCSVADQSENLGQEGEYSNNKDPQNLEKTGKDTKNSENDSKLSNITRDISKELSNSTERVRKKKTPMKFIYPSKSHILDAIPQKVFQFEENSQTERRKSLVKPVLVANIVPKNDEGLVSPKQNITPLREGDKGSKTISVPISNITDNEVSTDKSGSEEISNVREDQKPVKESELTKDENMQITNIDLQKLPNGLNDTSCSKEVGDVDKPNTWQSIGNSFNKDQTQVPVPAATSLQGFQSASGKTIKLTTESINKASKLLLDETDNVTPALCEKELKEEAAVRSVNAEVNDVVDDADGMFVEDMEFSEEWTEDFDLEQVEPDDKCEINEGNKSSADEIRVDELKTYNDNETEVCSLSGDANLTNVISDSKNKSMMSDELKGFGGFKTASGKKVKCSEEQMKKAESYFNEETEGHDLPKTGAVEANNSVSELPKAIENKTDASSKENTYITETNKSGVSAISSFGGFSTASGKTLKLSDTNIKKANTIFGDISNDFEKIGIDLKIQKSNLDDDHTLRAPKTTVYGDKSAINVENTDAHSLTDNQFGFSIQFCKQNLNETSAFEGFSTAGGKALKLSDINLKKASSIFGDIAEELKEDVQKDGGSSTEQTENLKDFVKNKPISKAKPSSLMNTFKLELENDMSCMPESLDLLTEELQTLKCKKNTESSCVMPSTSRGSISVKNKSGPLESKKKANRNVPKGFRPFKAPRPSGGINVGDKAKAKYPESKTIDWGNPLDGNDTEKDIIPANRQLTRKDEKTNSCTVLKDCLPGKQIAQKPNMINSDSVLSLHDSNAQTKENGYTKTEVKSSDMKVRKHLVHSADVTDHKTTKTDPETVKNHDTKVETETNDRILNNCDESKKEVDASNELETSNELYQGLSQMFAEDLEPSFEEVEKSLSKINDGDISSDQQAQKQNQAITLDIGNTALGFTSASDKVFSISEKYLLSAQKLFDGNDLGKTTNAEKFDEQDIRKTDRGEARNKDTHTPEPNGAAPSFDCKRSLNTSIASLENDSIGRKETDDEKDDSELSITESQELLAKKPSENLCLKSLKDEHIKDQSVEKNITAVPERKICSGFPKTEHQVGQKVQLDAEPLVGINSKMCFGFQTASGKQVAISEKAVAQAKTMLDDSLKDLDDSGNRLVERNEIERKDITLTENILIEKDGIDRNLSPSVLESREKNQFVNPVKIIESKNEQFFGFQTASGKNVHLSESALEKGRQTFEVKGCGNNSEEDIIDENELGLGKEIPKHDSSSEFQKLEDKEIGGKESFKCKDEKEMNKIELGSFQTASGKTVDISENAILNAQKTLDIDTERDSKSFSFADSFKTASGKSVEISEKALSEARKTLDDGHDNSKTFDSFKTASGKSVEISQSALLKANKTLNDNDDSCEMKLSKVEMFQTASRKEVKISNKALAHARQTLNDTHNEMDRKSEKLKQYPSTSRVLSETHISIDDITSNAKNPFKTASGHKVEISAKALAHTRKLFEEVENDNNISATKSFQTGSGSEIAISEKSLASMGDDKSKKMDDFAGIGFQTASGSKVAISEKALAHARKSLEDVVDEKGDCVESTFHTPSKSKDDFSKKDTETGKNSLDFESGNTGFNAVNSFQTASGSTVTVSEKALTQVRKSLDDLGDNKEYSATDCFQTASQNKVNISEKALILARKSLEGIESAQDACIGNTFQMASGGKVAISKKALAHARKSLEIETDAALNDACSFQTASGSKVNISEKALALGRKSMEDDESKKGMNSANPFQTASGSKVAISEKALAFTRKSLHDAQDDKGASSLGSLFTTAKGTQVKVSDKALSIARRSLGGSGNSGDNSLTAEESLTKPIENAFNKHDENNKDNENAMEDEIISLQLERDRLSKNKRSFETMTAPERTEAQSDAGNRTFETCSSLPVKRQKLEDGLEKTFEDIFDKELLKRKPLKSRPEGTTTDRRHPGFRPFKPVRCNALQKPKISLDEICKTGTETNSRKDLQIAKSTFSTPYRTSAGTPQVFMETANKVKVTAPIFRTNMSNNAEGSSRKSIEHKQLDDSCNEAKIDNNCTKSLKMIDKTHIKQTTNIDYRNNVDNMQNSEAQEKFDDYKNNKRSGNDSCINDSVTDQDKSISDLGLPMATSITKAKKPESTVYDELDSDMDSYSQDEQDVFYCTLVEARRQQEEIIKSKVKVRPLVGRLFEMKEMTGRWKLKDLVVKTNISLYTTKPAPAVYAATAQSYKFCLDNHYSKHTAHVLVGDGAFLVPDDAGYVGKEEFYSAFLTLAGVDIKLISEPWLYNHYRWIVWKLAAYEVCIPSLCGRCLTPEMVTLQLKYRYDREIDLAQRSAIRKIFERDDTPCKRMVLCVAGIQYRGGIAKEPANTNAKILDGQVTLELTDGWYSIWAQLDVPLSDLVRHGRISVGQKICITGAELIGGDGACSPLEAPESVMLKICSNSTRPCPWDCPLGYQKDPRPLCVPLSSLYGEGGAVGIMDVILVRKYPILYMEKLPGGGNVFRTGRCEEKARQEYESRRQIDMQKVLRDIEVQADKENKQEKPKSTARVKWSRTEVESLCTGQEIYDGLNCAQQPDTYQSYLSDRQMELLYEYQRQVQEEKQAEMNTRFQSAWQDKQETAPDRNVTPVLKFRVCGCSRTDMDSSTNTILTVWRPATEISELQEGKRYKIYSLTTSSSRSKYTGHSVQLTATKQTKFQLLQLDENFLDNIYEPREVLWVSDIKRRRPAYGELDFVGLIVKVVPATAIESGKPCDTVYLADCQGAVLALKIWNGFKSFGEDLFIEGRILCCSNLMDKSTFRSHHLPIVEAASEFTTLNKTPQNSSHRKALERLNTAMKEKPEFLESTQSMLDNFLTGASPYPAESSIKTTPVKRSSTVAPSSCRNMTGESTTSNSDLSCNIPTPAEQKETQTKVQHEDMEVSTNTPHTLSTPQNVSTPQSDQSKKQKSVYQSKMARLLSYGSPSCLSPMSTPVTRGVRKGFKPPAFKK